MTCGEDISPRILRKGFHFHPAGPGFPEPPQAPPARSQHQNNSADAYGFDEELWGWLALLQDELGSPFSVHALGLTFEVEEVEIKYGREKFAACLAGQAYLVDTTDVTVDDPVS